jgi:ubiquinone biosynthesis protein
MDYSLIRKRIVDELGAEPENLFASFDTEAFAAASLGQVHRARLRDGREVAVKVQRPGIRKLFEVDLEIVAHLAALMENHLEGWKVHRPTAVVQQIAATLEQEIDFTIEAAHVERFAFQFANEPTVYLPEVYRDLTTPRVLTMEYVDGIKASQFAELESAPADRPEIARRIADLVMKQIFAHGFFHADPHPGNIHILPGARICFLDFGMMGFLDQRGREAFADLVWGIVRRNEISVANALLKLASADQEPPRQGLEADVGEFMHQHFYRPMGELEFGRLITQLLQITGKHGLSIPPDFFIMLKALSLMEGLVRRLNPQHDIITQAAPFLRHVRLSRLRPKKFVEGLFEFGLDFAEMAREFPSEMRRIFSQIKTGEARVIFKHDGLEPLLHSWDRVSNRLSFAIVLAALIIGSSLMVHADIPPKWKGIPVIGLIGFVLAALMGFWLLVSILRHGRM